MKLAKILIVFTFLLAVVLQVSAQDGTPKIVWKNLQEKYESFYDINPLIINESDFPIYYDAYYFPYIDFERFDEKSNTWNVSQVWHCGTGYKPTIAKVKPSKQIPFGFGKNEWHEITTEDSIGASKFRRFSEYEGKGKYRFKFKFGVTKSNADSLISYSPEFEVVEKGFKK